MNHSPVYVNIQPGTCALPFATGRCTFYKNRKKTDPAPKEVTVSEETYSTDAESLYLSGLNLTDEDIQVLSEFQNLTELNTLLFGNQIDDLAPLKNLTKLTTLDLSKKNQPQELKQNSPCG